MPLEYSVARMFQQFVNWQPGEFQYERKDAEGVPRIFSVDVHSSHIDSKRNFWLEALVECKYRYEGTRWIFTPRDYEPLLGHDFGDLYVTLDQCCPDRQLNRSLLAEFRDNYPLCGKGIEILPTESNPKTIEQAVQQLRYAVVAKAIDAIVHQLDELLGKPTPLLVVVPIIVTTAELWRLRPGTTIEDIKMADDIQTIADPHDLIVLLHEPDNIYRRHAIEQFHETLDETQIKRFDEILRATAKTSFESFVDYFASSSPTLFVIIRYDRLKSAVTNFHAFFAQSAIVTQRNES
jgi:hypothetical protein